MTETSDSDGVPARSATSDTSDTPDASDASDAADTPDDSAEPGARRFTLRRLFAAIFYVALATGLVWLTVVLQSDDAQAVHSLTSKSLNEINATVAPDDVDKWIRLDVLYMTLVTIALLAALRRPRGSSIWAALNRNDARDVRLTGHEWWRLGGIVATFTYFTADLVETSKLADVARSDTGFLRPVAIDVLSMARANNLKWIALACALIAIAARWSRRTPQLPGGTGSWGGPADVPLEPPGTIPARPDDDFRPSKDRLGVAISGGGIRSASFALGALGELRRRGVLAKARYVTAVSGGSYAAGALEHANRIQEPPERTEHRLRRRLNYLLPDTRTSFAGLVRILLGLFVNLCILWIVIYVVVRPIGWTIGTPMIQEGLRYDRAVVIGVVADGDDPDDTDRLEKWNDPLRCGLEVPPDTRPTVKAGSETASATRFQEATVTLIEFELDAPRQCLMAEHDDSEERLWQVSVTTRETGLIRLEDGAAEILRQPTLEASNPKPVGCRGSERLVTDSALDATPDDGSDNASDDDANENDANENGTDASVDSAVDDPAAIDGYDDLPRCRHARTVITDLVEIELPDLELNEEASTAIEVGSVAELIDPIEPVQVVPVSIVDLRGGLDVDTRHLLVPALAGLALLGAWFLSGLDSIVRRPTWRRRVWAVGRVSGWTFLALSALFLVFPWLVKVVPEAINDTLVAGPTEEQLANTPWLPSGLNPLLAWPVLAIGTITRFVQQRRAASATAPSTAKTPKRNTAAFLSKVITVVTRLAVGLVLILLVVTTAVTQMTTAAINGPFGDYTWLTRELFSTDQFFPADLVVWTLSIVVLLFARTLFTAGSWSLGPYYRRQLRWAFMHDTHGHDAFDGSDETDGAGRDRAGNLEGTNAELVICGAANVLGSDRAPAGRRAVSFTASRSWIGGPEIGWMPTDAYLARLGDARRDDVSVTAMTALSGAAASPAMGKQSMGPIGSILAILNVRLGGWLPHPQAVQHLPEPGASAAPGDLTRWRHKPGWPYFVREVIRRHRHEAAYLYVSDGGHWENLGLVESLRRGCNTIIVISAAGDGAASHATLAEAIEIARTDLGVEIDFDDVWGMRPPVGGDTDLELPSGRQFLRQSGDDPELGRTAPRGWAYGTFTRTGVAAPHDVGDILLLEATMVDRLAADVHAYAEGHHEFPDINTGDQFFDNRDFESYRKLGETLARRALTESPEGRAIEQKIQALP